jgi:transposase
MAAKPGASRRRHSEELKAEVVGECMRPGASVAAVSLARGLNTNLVHHWLRSAKLARHDVAINVGPGERGFIEVELPSSAPKMPAPQDIRIEVRRGATKISIAWPTSAAADCTAWMRELLR